MKKVLIISLAIIAFSMTGCKKFTEDQEEARKALEIAIVDVWYASGFKTLEHQALWFDVTLEGFSDSRYKGFDRIQFNSDKNFVWLNQDGSEMTGTYKVTSLSNIEMQVTNPSMSFNITIDRLSSPTDQEIEAGESQFRRLDMRYTLNGEKVIVRSRDF